MKPHLPGAREESLSVARPKGRFAAALLMLIAVALHCPLLDAQANRNQMTMTTPATNLVSECSQNSTEVLAARVKTPLDAHGLPDAGAWQDASAVAFCWDWQGENADPVRETEVRVAWTPEFLFLRYRAKYREIYVYPQTNSRVNKLWDRDVAEVFLQPDGNEPRHYKEFEISPNGNWIDLDIAPGKFVHLTCALRTRVTIDTAAETWVAELGIPMECLTSEFDAKKSWRLNLFRIEGPEPNRFYSAWRPTKTPKPNFHVPEAFGVLRFAE